LLVVLALFAGPRAAGFVYLILALIIAIVLVITRVYEIYWWFWLIPLFLLGLALLIWIVLAKRSPCWWKTLVYVLAVLFLVVGVVAYLFVGGKLVGINSAA